MTPLEPIHTIDDLVIKVTVTFAPGSAVTTLIGATVEAYARYGTTTVTASTVVVTTATEMTVTFNDSAFTAGSWEGQAIVTQGTVTQTVAEFSVEVKPSFRP